ncbi:HPr family phosphocarrier protein [Klebsiella quasipneumoniae]|uniref:HPr family phosphocarrier protein n=1 Tax=Klebsiella quasipneumoniae TaxID=1463165 RepID=UPI003873C536
MSEIITYQCDLKDGIHARPAGYIERLCNTFQSTVCWNNIRSGIQGNGKAPSRLSPPIPYSTTPVKLQSAERCCKRCSAAECAA